MCKAYIFLAEGFEEIEALTPIDILRRAGVDVAVVSVTGAIDVCGGHGINVRCDILFEDASFDDGTIAILPGGSPGYKNLKTHTGLLQLLKRYNEQRKYIAAICGAPTVLAEIGLLENRCAVCYPGLENELTGAIIGKNSVETDGNIITSKAVGTAIEFALQITAMLTSVEAADNIRQSIVYGAK